MSSWLYPFSSSRSQPENGSKSENQSPPASQSSGEDPGDRSSGFDPESLERGAKALREINRSPNAKQVFEVMRKQEQTRLAEVEAEKVKMAAIQLQLDIVSC
uniref:ATPase family AAA domain-containing protein n=1 Tax=Opuntia streptacantha TaxID=393608 RepID=A0A7C9E8P1_OPUST